MTLTVALAVTGRNVPTFAASCSFCLLDASNEWAEELDEDEDDDDDGSADMDADVGAESADGIDSATAVWLWLRL